MREEAIDLLRELTEAHCVPGHEDEVRAVFVDELGSCGELFTDKAGSVFCDAGGEGPRVLVAGHMDEVGFMVQNVTVDGFLQFVPLGGWWSHTLLSQRVEVKTRSGEKILGVISSVPPHFLPQAARNQALKIEQLYIDVGASSREQAMQEMGISLGDPVAPVTSFTQMAQEDLFMAKALDNRLGMAGVIQAAKILDGSKLPNRLILGGTVQEEVGLRGAGTAASVTRPDVAILLEAPPADDTPGFSRADGQGRLGEGVQIRMFDPKAIANPRLARLAIEIAEAEGIPHQVTVRRSGGTDAGEMHKANQGIPSLVLGVPARYIHSHNAIMHIDDYLNMVTLVIALVRRLDEETVEGLTKYL